MRVGYQDLRTLAGGESLVDIGRGSAVTRASEITATAALRLAPYRRLLSAVLPPLVALTLQFILGAFVNPSVWFLFYPAVFLSSWIGGLRTGVVATALSTLLVLWFFVPPEHSLVKNPGLYIPATVFFMTGVLFAIFHEHLRKANEKVAGALAASERANESLDRAIKERRVFAALIDNSSDFIGIADPSGKPVYVNPAGRRMVGLASDHPVESTRIPEYYPPAERAFASDVIVKSMIEKGHWQGETYFRHWQTEEAIPVSDTHFMIRDPENRQLLGMGTITRDISDIRRAREELERTNAKLRASEAKLSGLISTAADAIISVDDNGRITMYNEGAQQIFGWAAEEITGKPLEILIPEHSRQIHRRHIDDFKSEPVKARRTAERFAVFGLRKNGIEFPAEAAISKLELAGRRLLTVFLRDVTERRKLQDQLMAYASEIEDLYDTAPCGYHSLDAEGTFVRINATELGWIGCRRDEVVGKLKPTSFFTEEGRAQFEKEFPKFLRTGRISDMEFDLVGRNGQTRRVSVSATVVRDASGVFKMSRGVMFDVTDRHRALEALRGMTEQLEQRVAERTQQLRALASDLEAAEDRERRQIARDLHDDLGQTLAAASVRLAGLCSDPRDNVRRTANTVATLIDQASASTRSLAAQLAPAVLYELGLTPALEWLSEEVGRAFGLNVSIRDDGRPKPLSQGARSVLYRGVRELVIIVAKHARTDHAIIEVDRVDTQIVVRVSDAGVGYDPAALTARPRRGLGLVSVRERLSFIGGKLEVQSVPGDGTVAILSAPLSSEPEMAAERPA